MKKNFLLQVLLSVLMLTSVSISAQQFSRTFDTYINQVTPSNNMNVDYPARLEVRKNSGSGNERITLIEFNIGSLSTQTTKAELNLYLYQVGNANNAVKTETVEVYDFSNYTISANSTWTSIGTYTLSSALSSKTITITGGGDANNNNTSANGWYKFDVTSLVNTLANTSGTDKKVKLLLKNVGTNLLFRFFSHEAPAYTSDGQSSFPEPATGKEPFLDIASTQTAMQGTTSNLNVSIFSNTNKQIIVNFNDKLENNASIEVYNSIGEQITTQQISNASTVISKSYKSGVYFVKVINGGKNITKKIILN